MQMATLLPGAVYSHRISHDMDIRQEKVLEPSLPYPVYVRSPQFGIEACDG